MEIRDIPWITDGANDFLNKVIPSGEVKTILEFGSGASTYWLAKQGVDIISVEHDKAWYDFLSKKFKDENMTNVRYIHAPRPYNNICKEFHDNKIQFDLVIDDGRDRVAVAGSSHGLVKPNGYFMLDNDERHRYGKVHTILKDWEKTPYEQDGPDYTGWIKWKTHHDTHRWITTVWKRPK